ncbi:MAG: hypothetical protein ACTS5A_01520 [Candidatus Hodgkinia cicadicola]
MTPAVLHFPADERSANLRHFEVNGPQVPAMPVRWQLIGYEVLNQRTVRREVPSIFVLTSRTSSEVLNQSFHVENVITKVNLLPNRERITLPPLLSLKCVTNRTKFAKRFII